MQDTKAAQKIRHHSKESEKFIEPRMWSFEHDFVGALSRRHRSGLTRDWNRCGRRRFVHTTALNLKRANSEAKIQPGNRNQIA